MVLTSISMKWKQNPLIPNRKIHFPIKMGRSNQAGSPTSTMWPFRNMWSIRRYLNTPSPPTSWWPINLRPVRPMGSTWSCGWWKTPMDASRYRYRKPWPTRTWHLRFSVRWMLIPNANRSIPVQMVAVISPWALHSGLTCLLNTMLRIPRYHHQY